MAKKPRKLNNGGGIGRISGLADGSGVTAKHNMFLIDDETLTDARIKDQVYCPVVDNNVKGHGMKPRQHSIYPAEMFKPLPPDQVKVLSKDEITERATRFAAEGGTLRKMMEDAGLVAMDQNGQGYCWGHSTTMATMVARLAAGMKLVLLSAYSVCSTIKRGRDEGGWCGLSAQFIRTKGVMPQNTWPQGDYRNPGKYDNEANWKEALKYRSTGEFVDLTRDVYDQNMARAVRDSLGVMGMPRPQDYNWWGHSVCMLDTVIVEAGSFGDQGINSWTPQWGDHGYFTLRGSKAEADSALCIYMTLAA